MQCRKVSLTFRRKLTSEEQTTLISYFKGFIERMKESMNARKDMLNPLEGVVKHIGNQQVTIVKATISSLMTPDATGKSTFEKCFALDWEETEPLDYHFTYPNPHAVFGLAGMVGQFRSHGVNLDAYDRMVFRDLMKEAKLDKEIDKIRIDIVEREV